MGAVIFLVGLYAQLCGLSLSAGSWGCSRSTRRVRSGESLSASFAIGCAGAPNDARRITLEVKRLAPEGLIVIAALLLIAFWVGDSDGIGRFLLFIAACAVVGGVLALIGNRFPMIYRQNRRDRRRRSGSSSKHDDSSRSF